MNNIMNIDESVIKNLDAAQFEVLDSEELSENEEKAILGASCTTCTCCCSCCG